MIESSTSCDVCGITKAAVNHWYDVWTADGVLYFKGGGDDPRCKQVCGHAHAHEMLDRWLSTGTLEKAQDVRLENEGQ